MFLIYNPKGIQLFGTETLLQYMPASPHWCNTQPTMEQDGFAPS